MKLIKKIVPYLLIFCICTLISIPILLNNEPENTIESESIEQTSTDVILFNDDGYPDH